ncbi:SDR family oxidoreductase [Candidatus Micrarchaeota archaeon]|nr:SDR family oxidoreductase [Candidatus Micrarchaeota archaeon]
MAKYLVTGGAGFIGSHIAERLLKDGHEVRILDDFSTGKKENIEHLKGKIEVIIGDVSDKNTAWDATKEMDYVFHEAAFTSVQESIKNPGKCWRINITGTQHILNGAVKYGVKRVVLASSAAIYGASMNLPKKEDMEPNAISPYGNSKIMNEISAKKYMKEEGLDTVCLRYFNVFGPRQDHSSEYSGVISKFVDLMMHGERPVVYGDGKQTRDFVYVGDVVEANMLAMKENKAAGLSFNVATGKQVSLLHLIELINEILGTDLKPQFENAKQGDIKFSYADITKAKELLGFEANVGIREGLEKTIEWMKR